MTGKWVPTDEVAAMLAGWRPRAWSDADTEALDTVIADVRRWVAATRPATVRRTGRMLRYVSGLVLLCLGDTGSSDVRRVFYLAKVDHWVMSIQTLPAAVLESTAPGGISLRWDVPTTPKPGHLPLHPPVGLSPLPNRMTVGPSRRS